MGCPVPAGATGDADWIATQATERPEQPASPEQPVEPAHTVELGSETDEPDLDAAPEDTDGAETEDPSAGDATTEPRRTSRKGRRPSVPSWDEIMFGGGKSE